MSANIAGITSGVGVDSTTDKGLYVNVRPPAIGSLGAYSKSLTSGLIVATGSANAIIWSMRWTDATRLCLVERVRVGACVTGTITTAVPYNLQLFYSRSYTVSPTTSIGTTATLSGGNAKRRTSMGTTLLGGMWILGTAAAGLTTPTLGNDTDALATIVGASGTVIGTQFFGANATDLWKADGLSGQYPILLTTNEGLTIQAPLAGPATGTFQVAVSVEWSEVAAF